MSSSLVKLELVKTTSFEKKIINSLNNIPNDKNITGKPS